MPTVTPVTLDPRVKQLSDGSPSGTVMGVTGDALGFYGLATPIVQPSGNQQAAISRANACGSIGTFNQQLSPAGIATITTAEANFTAIQSGTGPAWTPGNGANITADMVYVNKPTAQAGLGYGNLRVSGANALSLTFSNFSGATITPTASEAYSFVALRGFGNNSVKLTPAAIVANTTAEQQFTVTGLNAGELVQVIKPTAQAGIDIMGCRVVSNNTLGITFGNVTAATVTPTAGETYTVLSLGGIDAPNNEMVVQVNVGTVTGIATVTAPSQSFGVSSLAASDITKGVMKPTIQAGVGVVGAIVTAAGTLALQFVNPTGGTVTPTAGEVYAVSIHRPNPVAPMKLYSTSLAPTSVAANTTAEQTFTVTGLISGSPVWVNKPTAQAGLGIVGVRVSASNTLALTYGNATATAIVPTTEVYTIGNFQLPFDKQGNSVIQTASLVDAQQSVLTNAIRSALTSLGLVAGV